MKALPVVGSTEYPHVSPVHSGTLEHGDRGYNNKALVSTLKQIHDDLYTAVLDTYGWPQDITDEQILEHLVALNAERADEERNGHIRWLRPEYQAPDQAQPI